MFKLMLYDAAYILLHVDQKNQMIPPAEMT